MLGDIEIKKIEMDYDSVFKLKERFIALDTETTGLDPTKDLITEIGLALYQDGKLAKKYSSLIHINELIPDSIVNLTGITNEMIKEAPSEEKVYQEVVDFLGDILNEKTIIVAHNACFDLAFLSRALIRFGYIGVINYVDTLSTSRSLIKGLFNYKQETIAAYFGITNDHAHRALSDAITCGEIMNNLINLFTNDVVEFGTNYDDCFTEMVRERGIIYYKFNRVSNYIDNNTRCSATVLGTKNYHVELEFKDNKLIAKCDCPYYVDNNVYCKHIYAALFKKNKIEYIVQK